MNFNLWKNRILILSTLILNYTDLVTDILVAIDFAKAQEWFYFGACVFFVCIGPFILAVLVPVKERPCLTTVTQFLCLAPIFSAFDALKNGESNEVSWGHCFRTTKFVGSMLESLPEAGLQAFFLLESYMKSGATPGELQILSLTLAFISIVTATTTGRIGAVKFLPKEFNTDGIPIKILLMLASACELLSRIVSLCMALVAFPYAGAGLVGVEFLARLIFFAVIVEEEEIMHRVFSGFAASFFNLFMLAPGPWVGLPFESTGVKNTGALKGVSNYSRKTVWRILLAFTFTLQMGIYGFCAFGPSIGNLTSIMGVCRNADGGVEWVARGQYNANGEFVSWRCWPLMFPVIGVCSTLMFVLMLGFWTTRGAPHVRRGVTPTIVPDPTGWKASGRAGLRRSRSKSPKPKSHSNLSRKSTQGLNEIVVSDLGDPGAESHHNRGRRLSTTSTLSSVEGSGEAVSPGASPRATPTAGGSAGNGAGTGTAVSSGRPRKSSKKQHLGALTSDLSAIRAVRRLSVNHLSPNDASPKPKDRAEKPKDKGQSSNEMELLSSCDADEEDLSVGSPHA